MASNELLICSSVAVTITGSQYTFDIKFMEGMKLYAELWKGPIKCIMRLDRTGNIPFASAYNISDLPFELEAIDDLKNISNETLKSSAIVLASADSFELLHVSKLCHKLNIPCVYVIENITETTRQIVKLQNNNKLRTIKAYIWIWLQELRRRRAFKYAAGLQANGVPAYRHYSPYYKNVIQYFDTRMLKKMYPNELEMNARKIRFDRGKKLRLVYSGRLESLKGVEHLIPISAKLRELGVSFRLELYGSGSLESLILKQIKENKLDDCVKYRGSVDFETELVPILKNNADIFICCHRQSDPSCTYLEVLSCGLPIVGYLNKAFKGILDESNVGLGVVVDDVDGIVEKIVYLNNNKGEIINFSKNALDFAKKHDFHSVFNNRIDHLRNTFEMVPEIRTVR